MGSFLDNARPMTNDDGTQTKNQEKERVIAAITALKVQGADINPYTVSGEAQVPRSTLYRDPELMDLIYKERNGDDSSHMSSDEIQSKIAELEESNQALNEQIWDLEKQLESMTKLKQDAYVQGFQAGINEAAKRKAAGAIGEVAGSRPALQIPDAAVETVPTVESAETVETAVAGESAASEATEYQPTPVAVGLGETDYKFTEPATAVPKSNGEGKSSRKKVDDNTGDYEPLSDSHIAGDFHFGDSLMSQDDSYEMEEKVVASAPAVASKPQPAAPIGEETGEHDIFDDIESVLSEQKAPVNSGPDIDFTLHQERPEPEPVAPAQTGPIRKKKNFPDIDFGLSGDSDSSNGESHHEDAVAAGAREAAPADKHASAAAAQSGEDSAVAQMTRDGDGIYNIARSGPTISSSAYNPLVELSWKDLQTVYNFSVASLKDYAKPGFGNEPGALGGTNFADSSTHEPKPVQQRHHQAALDTSDSLDLPGPDPRRTGDRLQALSDPRNLLDSEAIVDLDALDIFDDLDDYVDLDKIEVISDVVSKPKAEEPSMGGDELRELIKGRIKQAADIPNEPSAPRMTTPPPAGSAASKDSAPGGGPRNKFIGGAKAGQEPPSAVPAFVVKTIPPEIRKSFMILGLKPEEATTRSVIEAWKKQIASPGVHPDLGGDTEAAVYLNTAKDQLVRWLDQQAPKLGKKFGQPHKPEPPKPKKEED